MPQDSVLGLILFIIYKNKLPETFYNQNVTTLADDRALLIKTK